MLWTAWPQLEKKIAKQPVILFLDYDGTLTPLVAHPRLARLSRNRRQILRSLARVPEVEIAVISGRPLGEIKKQVDIPGLLYAGNHGLEFEGPRLRFVHPEALKAKTQLRKLAQTLRLALKPFRGAWVEDKTYSLSIHYRLVEPRQIETVKTLFLKIFRLYADSIRFVLYEGKKVWEIRPRVAWNKGTLVSWLLGRHRAQTSQSVFPIYVGDDQTDEDAFRALRQTGFCIKVTEEAREPSLAAYFLPSPGEVFKFLKRLRRVKISPGAAHA